VVSLYVNFGDGSSVRESDMPDFDRFYDELRSADQLPTTSQPSVGDFTAAYEPLLAGGRDVVSVHISGVISGTCDTAQQAADALEREGKGGERVHVIDSSSTAGGLGMVALAGGRCASSGGDAQAVVERVEEAREEMKIWFALDTLEYLKRSGRVGAASAWIGSTLKVKPILTMSDGEMSPVERVRTSSRAFERLVDYARQRHSSGADAFVVQHIQAPDDAARLVERCSEIFGTGPAFVSEAGPVVGVHAGPGMLGVGGCPLRLLT